MSTAQLDGGFSIVAHHNSGEEFTRTDCFLRRPRCTDRGLASTDPDRIGPGLCWSELAVILHAPEAAVGVSDPHACPLLPLPVLGDAGAPAEAVESIAVALTAQGAPQGCEPLARRLLA